jgi:hypothetical protein
MVTSVEGIYRDGKVELLEPTCFAEGSRVIVTLASDKRTIDLQARGIREEQAADLRWRLRTITDDWNDPSMDVYDEL